MDKSISQKEYLKKYLSSGHGEEKKKKKKLKIGPKTVKIIDDDIDLNKLRPIEDGEFDIFINGEDAPQIAGIIDERGPVDFSDKRKWKIIADNEDGELRFKQNDSVISREKEKESKIPDSDLNVLKKSKKISDSDLSPPRKSRKTSDSDLSPPRRNKKDSDSNLSPPRRNKRSNNSNLSPHRKSRKDNDSDLNPLRKSKKSDRSTSRHSKKSKKDYDSHKRCRNSSRWDDQPDGSESSSRENTTHDTKMKKTLSGMSAGLQDAKSLREETEAYKKREIEMFSRLSKEITGAGQKAILRDSRTGRRRDLEAEAAVEREKQKRQEELNEKYDKWGRGLKQIEDREEKLKNYLHEVSKPLARYADDADLDKALREQEKEGDPMLEYIRNKKIKEGKIKPDELRYQGSYMPNRFGIKPGHRWDGVDRSNGYEKKWFDAQNAKTALQEEAYRWSTADM
ncbi:PREDICTED: BUD13 homolog [Polistes canadensis]|uniref:BUD13 homolog n=1 Tax=Polistes canadensis TaxID=91411 RepID=UPI000718D343|nr:PREDICTED: BUD13 homolog [Polistes canadensis]